VKRKGKKTMTDRNQWTVRDSKDRVHTVTADRVTVASGSVSFWNKGTGVLDDMVAHFTNHISVEPVPGRVYPAPVAGTEYYTLEDMRRALKELNYHDPDYIINRVKKQVSVRDDGRYDLDELKRAAGQLDRTLGSYYQQRLDEAALQARKNRVFDAHGGK